MATNVSHDQILDAIVSKLRTELVPAAGASVTAGKPAYSCQRYEGSEFATEEGFERGIAGRCPALRVRSAGTATKYTTIGRRVDRVESTFSVIVCSDKQRTKDDRGFLLALCETVRNLVAARRFSLAINPMRWRDTRVVSDDDKLLAFALTFTTKHRTDYAVTPVEDPMRAAYGEIADPQDADGNPGIVREEVGIIFEEEVAA